MIYKILLSTALFFSIAHSSVEEVRVGKIDSYYEDSISKQELETIIKEIEITFESQLGFDVFNYSVSGKPIDILYVPPLKREKQIAKKIELLEQKNEEIEKLRTTFPAQQKRIEEKQKILKEYAVIVNKKTDAYNHYVNNINKQKHLTGNEYKNAVIYIKNKKSAVNREIRTLKKERRAFKRILKEYNMEVSSFNRLIREHNRLQNQIQRMNRTFKKVKGKAFGLKEISLKTYMKNGKKVRERSVKNTMTKIEIYGFENKKQLKAVLAHEIGHLVGIPHINTKGSLMHPILQNNQEENLFLNDADIRNFKRNETVK